VTWERVAVQHEGAIARVWLDRPRALNALDTRALEELAAAFASLGPHAGTRVVVLGGRGPSFSAGADRKNPPARLPRSAGAAARRHAAQVGLRALEAIERCEAITVARLHGHVIGGGVVLALGCDLRVAAATTRFHIPEVDLGVPLTWGAVPRLAREVGAARAKDLILLCEAFDAGTAERWGLVTRVVADDALDAAVADVATRLAAKPEWAVHMTKTQFQAYARASVLGDVTALDGDLLRGAAAEDPARFAWTRKRDA
jgi:enoyl-CoA hydratase/carnithine racemase